MRKRVARIGAALLVVLAIGGTAAAAAQAHEWTIESKTLVERGLASEKLGFSKASNFTFAFEISPVIFEWTCVPTFKEGAIAQGGKGNVQIGFSACGGIVGEPFCTITPLANPTLRTELIEVEKVLYLKFQPPEFKGENLFNFFYGGPSCTAGAEWHAQGSFAGRIVAAKTSQTEHALEFSPAINTAAGVNFHFGLKPFEMNAGFTETLAGGSAGKSWAAE